MALSDRVISAARFILQGDVARNRPNSEAINVKIASSINSLLDSSFYDEAFTIQGFLNPESAYNEGWAGIRRIDNTSTISLYYMSLGSTGSSGSTSFNIAVYNQNGDFVNNLFGNGTAALSLTAQNSQRVVIGRESIGTAPTTIETNIDATDQAGILNLTTLLEGYILVPFMESTAIGATNLHFNLRLREQ